MFAGPIASEVHGVITSVDSIEGGGRNYTVEWQEEGFPTLSGYYHGSLRLVEVPDLKNPEAVESWLRS